MTLARRLIQTSLSLAIALPALTLMACGGGEPDTATTDTPTTTETPTDAPADSAPEPSETPDITAAPDTPEATPDAPEAAPDTAAAPQTYNQPDGLFQISFPAGYSYQEIQNGIQFVSSDGSFGGFVEYQSAGGETFTPEELGEILQNDYSQMLVDVTWQGNELQPDDSMRVDWVGANAQGQQFDAVSFIEQHGDTIYVLDVFGINAPYNNNDAQTIVGTYRVQN